MAAIDGFPAQSGVVDSVELRKGLAGLIVRDTAGNARPGIFPRHVNALVTSTATMNVAVAAFEAACVRGGGPILVPNDGSVNVLLNAAPGANSRIDVIWVRQKENGYGGFADGSNGAEISFTAGTAAASPVKPAIPTGALELATVLVPSGVSATNAGGVVITQTFQYTCTTGGTLWVRTAADLPSSFRLGDLALALDTGITHRHNGSAWKAWNSDWTTWGLALGQLSGTFSLGTSPGTIARYHYVEGDVEWFIKFVIGTGSPSWGTEPRINAPVNMHAEYGTWSTVGAGTLYDLSATTTFIGRARWQAAGWIMLENLYAGNARLERGQIDAVTPMALATGDVIELSGRYRPA